MKKLLLIDDEADVRYSFQRIFDSPQIQILCAASGEEGLELASRSRPDLVIMDIRMGGMNGLETLRRIRQADARLPVIMMTAYGTTQTAIEAMKLGAYDYLLKPFDIPRLQALVYAALKSAEDMRRVVSCEGADEAEDSDQGIVGRSEAMQTVFKLIGQLAASDATALITGESGTGKELVARAIYHHSRRNTGPFMAINCAALAENLLESELFGHEKGAFTGANTQRIGKFEQCHGGTLFLDEIGDMSPATQTKILRVLQDGTFQRVGGNSSIQSDVRVIAATNKGLEAAVASRQFREDLFYRLNVVRIQLPPLRERGADIGLLTTHFLRKFGRVQGVPAKTVSRDALEVLARYRWPGNVRELENVVCRACVLSKGAVIQVGDLPSEVLAGSGGESGALVAEAGVPDSAAQASETPHGRPPPQPAPTSSEGRGGAIPGLAHALFRWAREHPELKVLPAVERELIVEALLETRGNQVQAARLLGISRATLRKRIEQFEIKQEFSAG